MTTETCAVWYWRHHAFCYELHEDEDGAAAFAVALEDDGEGSVAGVQFADGRLVSRDDWAAYAAEQTRREQEWREAERRAREKPPLPTRQVEAPFKGGTVTIDADEPDWLGVPAASGDVLQPGGNPQP